MFRVGVVVGLCLVIMIEGPASRACRGMLEHVVMDAQMAHALALFCSEQSTALSGVRKVYSTDSMMTVVESQPPILECPDCDEEFLVRDMVFCHKNECMSYTCEQCSEERVKQCQLCGDFVCRDCWYEGGDEMSKDKFLFGSSCCCECAQED